jgi:hypothetical protein
MSIARRLSRGRSPTRIFATTDPIAKRVRKLGGGTLRSIGEINRTRRLLNNNAKYVTPLDMLAELRGDNEQLIAHMRARSLRCASGPGNNQPSRSLDRRWRPPRVAQSSRLTEAFAPAGFQPTPADWLCYPVGRLGANL